MPVQEHILPSRQITPEGHDHFFGYYDKSPWSLSGETLLALRVDSSPGAIQPEGTVTVGLIHLQDGNRFESIGRTGAWNWQQGCMAQWLDDGITPRIIYNTRTATGFGSTIFDPQTGQEPKLPSPIYTVSPDNKAALTVNYDRLHLTHPTIGYDPPGGAGKISPLSEDDGIFELDLATGESKTLVSLNRAAEVDFRPSMAGATHWFSHLAYNPSGERFHSLHRWSHSVEDQATWMHRLLTANRDGTDLRVLECTDHPLQKTGAPSHSAGGWHFQDKIYSYQISHPIWRDDTHILAWSYHAGVTAYHLYEDIPVSELTEVSQFGEKVLTENGHCSFNPKKDWLLTDTYPDLDHSERVLILYHPESDTRYDIGRFYSPPHLPKEARCDLHPRWSRDGNQVCIDSYHKEERQIYLLDIGELIG